MREQIREDSIRDSAEYVSEFLFSERASNQLSDIGIFASSSEDLELQEMLRNAVGNVSDIVSERDGLYKELLSSLDLSNSVVDNIDPDLKDTLLDELEENITNSDLSPKELLSNLLNESDNIDPDLKDTLLDELEENITNSDLSPKELLSNLLNESDNIDPELKLKSEILGMFYSDLKAQNLTEDEIASSWDTIISELDRLDPEDQTGVVKASEEMLDSVRKLDLENMDDSPSEAIYDQLFRMKEKEEIDENNLSKFEAKRDTSGGGDPKKGKGLADGARVFADSALSHENFGNAEELDTTSGKSIEFEIREEKRVFNEEVDALTLCALSDSLIDLACPSIIGDENFLHPKEGSVKKAEHGHTKHMRIEINDDDCE